MIGFMRKGTGKDVSLMSVVVSPQLKHVSQCLFPCVYATEPLMYIIKNDKRLVGSIYDISMLRRSANIVRHVGLRASIARGKDAVDAMNLSDVNQES